MCMISSSVLSLIVKVPMTPRGVEHYGVPMKPRFCDRVKIPMTPRGVEHFNEDKNYEPEFSEDSYDAARR